MARNRNRSQSRGSSRGTSHRLWKLTALVVTVLAVGAFTFQTGAFTAVQGDRQADVGAASDDNALLGLDKANSITVVTGGSSGGGGDDDDGDDDKGHGNDCDSHDEDNPGNSQGPPEQAQNDKNCDEDDGDDGDSGDSSPEQTTQDLVTITNNLNSEATITVRLADGADGDLSLGSGDKTQVYQSSGDHVEFDLPTDGQQVIKITPSESASGTIQFEIDGKTDSQSTVKLTRSVPVTITTPTPTPTSTPTETDEDDGNKGHGNDCDGSDEDNPGNSGGNSDNANQNPNCSESD